MPGKHTSGGRGKGKSSKGAAGRSKSRSTARARTGSPSASPRAGGRKAASSPSSARSGSAPRRSGASATRGKQRASTGKVGGDSEAARQFATGGTDFGVRERDVRGRTYASNQTKMEDPGGAPGHVRGEGVRDEGVGGNDSGPGSNSGGDVDTDFTGAGTGGSTIVGSGTIHRPPGPDDNDGTSNEYAAPGPKGHSDTRLKGKIGGDKRVRGSTVSPGTGPATLADGQGTAAVTNPEVRNDDSFAGEVSNDEATGADNSFSDNQP